MKHRSGALPAPRCARLGGGAASSPPAKPNKAPPLPAAGKTGHGSSWECPGGLLCPKGSSGSPHPAHEAPQFPQQLQSLPSSGAEHAQTRDCRTGARFPAVLPQRSFSPFCCFLTPFWGALRANLSRLWQRLRIDREGKESPGFGSGCPGKSKTASPRDRSRSGVGRGACLGFRGGWMGSQGWNKHCS